GGRDDPGDGHQPGNAARDMRPAGPSPAGPGGDCRQAAHSEGRRNGAGDSALADAADGRGRTEECGGPALAVWSDGRQPGEQPGDPVGDGWAVGNEGVRE